jgi:hypothetical protein
MAAPSSGPTAAALQPCERRPQPLAVRGVAPLKQEAQPHHVPGQPGDQHPAAQVVADLVGPAREVLLLGDAAPLAGQLPQPQVTRVPGQGLAHRLQLAQPVVVDGPGGHRGQRLLRRHQPVPGRDAGSRVEPEVPGQEGADPDHDHLGRPSPEPGRHPGQRLGVARLDQHGHAGPPVVVGGAGGVVAEHVAARPQPGRRVPPPTQPRGHHLLVQGAAELHPGHELRHRRTS